MNKVAIIGASGFIGTSLVDVLKKDKKYKIKQFSENQSILFDIKKLEKFVKDQDIIFHLAGIVDPGSPEIYKVNVLGTLNILEAIRISGSDAKVVFASTFGVYKIPQKGHTINENYDTLPRHEYGISKKLAENLIIFYSETYGIKASIARISNVYGPSARVVKHSVVSNFISSIDSNKEIKITGDGSQTRDFVYIDDVISALLIIANSKERLLIANICSGQETSLNDLVQKIQIVTNKQTRIKHLKAEQSDLGYWKGSSLLWNKPFYWIPKTDIEDGLKKVWKTLK